MLLQFSCIVLWGLTELLQPTSGNTRQPARAERPSRGRVTHECRIKLNDGAARCVVFSHDGRYVAACGKRFVHICEIEAGKIVHRLAGHTGKIVCVAFSPDGTRLASASRDKSIRLWDVRTGKLLKILAGHTDPITGLAFLRDNHTIASCSPSRGHRNYILLWDVKQGRWDYRVRKRRPSHFFNLTVSRDSSLLAVAEQGGLVAVYDVEDFGLRGRLGLRERFKFTHSQKRAARFVSFSTDATRLVSCGDDPFLRLWDVRRGRLLKTLRRPDNRAPVAAVFSRDGSRVISVTANGALEFWNCSNGSLLADFTPRGKNLVIRGMAISSNGRMLATCGDKGCIDLWRLFGDVPIRPSRPTSSRKEP